MCICRKCGKVIDSKFRFCPWCGFSRIKALAQSEEKENSQLKVDLFRDKLREHRYNQIEQMEEQLDNLERELSVLVLSAEMHK